MNPSYFGILGLNVFINSLLSFLTLALFVEGMILLCRIRHYRFRSILRMVPIFKLPIDLLSYDWTQWAIANGFNPLICPEGSRTLTLAWNFPGKLLEFVILPFRAYIIFTTKEGYTFSLADLLALSLPSTILILSVITIFLGSIYFLTRFLCRVLKERKKIMRMVSNGRRCYRMIQNLHVKMMIEKKRVNVFEVDELIPTPFITGIKRPLIVFPKHLVESMSQEEFEATLAHEVEHLRFHDIKVRLAIEVITNIFWWIPSSFLKKRIYQDQELAADDNTFRYFVSPFDLAQALVRAARNRSFPERVLSPTLGTQYGLKYRIRALTGHSRTVYRRLYQFVIFPIVTFLATGMLLGKLWVF